MASRQTAFNAFAHQMVRLCLVLLVITGPAPLQFVLCHEDGQQPRLEHAVNGQCISASRESCSECSGEHLQAVRGPARIDYSHRHCASCRDRILHTSPHNRLAKVQVAAVHHWLGGCLYSYAAADAIHSPRLSRLWPDRLDGALPSAALLVAESTCLLI